jgi:hypothetical protein
MSAFEVKGTWTPSNAMSDSDPKRALAARVYDRIMIYG